MRKLVLLLIMSYYVSFSVQAHDTKESNQENYSNSIQNENINQNIPGSLLKKIYTIAKQLTKNLGILKNQEFPRQRNGNLKDKYIKPHQQFSALLAIVNQNLIQLYEYYEMEQIFLANDLLLETAPLIEQAFGTVKLRNVKDELNNLYLVFSKDEQKINELTNKYCLEEFYREKLAIESLPKADNFPLLVIYNESMASLMGSILDIIQMLEKHGFKVYVNNFELDEKLVKDTIILATPQLKIACTSENGANLHYNMHLSQAINRHSAGNIYTVMIYGNSDSSLPYSLAGFQHVETSNTCWLRSILIDILSLPDTTYQRKITVE